MFRIDDIEGHAIGLITGTSSKLIASVEWERLREHEATMEDVFDHSDDFTAGGTAERYFQANRDRIVRHLGGGQEHSEGSFDWYSEWEKWARRQWEQQQQQSHQYQEYQQQQQQQQSYQQSRDYRTKQEFKWDFDVNDPYVFIICLLCQAAQTYVLLHY